MTHHQWPRRRLSGRRKGRRRSVATRRAADRRLAVQHPTEWADRGRAGRRQEEWAWVARGLAGLHGPAWVHLVLAWATWAHLPAWGHLALADHLARCAQDLIPVVQVA